MAHSNLGVLLNERGNKGGKGGGATTVSQRKLEAENAALKKQIAALKKKAGLPAGDSADGSPAEGGELTAEQRLEKANESLGARKAARAAAKAGGGDGAAAKAGGGDGAAVTSAAAAAATAAARQLPTKTFEVFTLDDPTHAFPEEAEFRVDGHSGIEIVKAATKAAV